MDENHCRAPDVTTAHDSSTQTRWQRLLPGHAVTVLDAIAGCGMSGLLWRTDTLESRAVWREDWKTRQERERKNVRSTKLTGHGNGNGRHGGYTVSGLVESVPA